MAHRSHRRFTALGALGLAGALALTACGSSSGGSSGGASTVGPSTTRSTGSALPTTTVMPDCGSLPTPAVIGAAVGAPVAAGQVTGSGSCQYLGVNDQSKSVTLAKYVSAGDQATWNDLQASLGAPAPYADPALPGALLGVDGTLYVTSNGAIYAALVNVTGGPAKDQAPAAAKLLATWLAG